MVKIINQESCLSEHIWCQGIRPRAPGCRSFEPTYCLLDGVKTNVFFMSGWHMSRIISYLKYQPQNILWTFLVCLLCLKDAKHLPTYPSHKEWTEIFVDEKKLKHRRSAYLKAWWSFHSFGCWSSYPISWHLGHSITTILERLPGTRFPGILSWMSWQMTNQTAKWVTSFQRLKTGGFNVGSLVFSYSSYLSNIHAALLIIVLQYILCSMYLSFGIYWAPPRTWESQ